MSINKIDETLKEEKVGDILNAFPCTKYFFDKYKIDYCCGGQTDLEKALNEHNINNKEVFNELIETINKKSKEDSHDEIIKSTDLAKKSNREVIDFIIDYYHEGLRENLPKLNEKLLKAMRAHIGKHKELLWKIHELLGKVIVLCESHLILEEEEIFKPMIDFDESRIKCGDQEFSRMTGAILEAIKEHDIMGPTLQEIASVTNNYTPPQDIKCETVKHVYKELESLQKHLKAHTQVENNILFPRYIKQ